MKALKICLFLVIAASCKENPPGKTGITPHETPDKPKSATETHPLNEQPQEAPRESPTNEKFLMRLGKNGLRILVKTSNGKRCTKKV